MSASAVGAAYTEHTPGTANSKEELRLFRTERGPELTRVERTELRKEV